MARPRLPLTEIELHQELMDSQASLATIPKTHVKKIMRALIANREHLKGTLLNIREQEALTYVQGQVSMLERLLGSLQAALDGDLVALKGAANGPE